MIFNEEAILKVLAGGSALSLFVLVWWWQNKMFNEHLDKERSANTAERQMYAQTYVASLKEVSAENREGLEKIEKTLGVINTTMVEMDRAHTSQNRELFMEVFGVVKDQKDATSQTAIEVKSLDGRVGRIEAEIQETRSVLDDHGAKLEVIHQAITMIPPPRQRQ